MDDLRTVFHLPINDAAKKVRKKKHALVILVRRNKQQQQEQKTKEFFFALGFLGALIFGLFLGATFTLFVFFARRRIWLFTQNSPPYDCPLSLKYTSWAYA